MATSDFKTLVDEMKGNNTTNNHNILVSYTQSKINELLRNVAKVEGELTLGPLKTEIYVAGAGFVPCTATFEFEHPAIQFIDDGEATIQYTVIGGKIIVGDLRTLDLADMKVSITVSANICNVLGKVNEEGDYEPCKDSEGHLIDAKPANVKVTLEAEQNQARCVCINMSDVTVKIMTAEKKNTDAYYFLMQFCTMIQEDIQNKGLIYQLAGVSNAYPKYPGSGVLQPVSFRFSITKDENHSEKNTLCMWIDIRGGEEEVGHGTSSVFRPKNVDRNPVPDGSSASVIISHYTLWNLYLKPNVANFLSDATDETPQKDDTKAFKIEGKLKAGDYDYPEDYEIYTDYDRKGHSEISFSLASPKSSLIISNGIIGPETEDAKITYQSNRQRMTWCNITLGYTSTGGKYWRGPQGAVHLDYSWAATAKWTNKPNNDHPNTLKLEWKTDAKWDVKVEAEKNSETPLTKFWDFISGNQGSEMPNKYKQEDVPAPKVDFTMNSLDYFLTTNLLYPGNHMFKAHKIGSSQDEGLAVPHDMILTGDIDVNPRPGYRANL